MDSGSCNQNEENSLSELSAIQAATEPTRADLAQATEASERSVRNWKKTAAIRPEYEERLRYVRDVALILQDSLTPRGVGQWLRARNRMLGGRRPLELIHESDLARVKEAAQAFVDGAYV